MRYVYRGLVIVNYDTEKKEVTFPDDPEGGGAAIQHVRIIEDDAKLLEVFFRNVFLHMMGGAYAAAADLQDTIV